MRNFIKLACCGAALALVLGVAAETRAGKPDKPPGKPGNDQPKTQACELTGDATGGGVVGVDAKSYGSLGMTVNADTALAPVFDLLGVSSYSGSGRVLKRQGRLDFHFNVDGSDCRPIEWGEEPGSDLDPAVCQYHMLLLNGVHDRKADALEFQSPAAEAQLFDYRAAPGSVLIGEGSANLTVQFLE